jgi:predicted nucleic acid-binding protein
MNTYALDTNIISYYLKKNQEIIEKVDIETNNHNRIIILPIVYFEIKRWLLLNNAMIKLAAFDKLCSHSDMGIIDKEILEIAISLYIDLRKRGLTIEDADILIAAYCIKNDCILATNNTKHFENIKDLKITNWIKQ